MLIPRATLLFATLGVGFLMPVVLPSVGLDYPYFFIMSIVLFAWFIIKWDAVKSIPSRSGSLEIIAGLGIVVADYAFNFIRGSTVGLVDLMIIFVGATVLVFGFRSLKFFWVPLAYGFILLAGYQIETYTPNYVALQNWLAGVLAGAVNVMGISATASGHLVSMATPSGAPILLDISSDCTGLQGILAFGMLSTMTLLDFKPRLSRIVPIFAIGFLGAFLINIVRLLGVFLTFEYLGIDAGTTMHVYFGYLIFIVWVMVFWFIAFKYLATSRTQLSNRTSAPSFPEADPKIKGELR